MKYTICFFLVNELKRFSLLFFSCLTLWSQQTNAQCSGGTAAGALTPAPTSVYQTMNVTTGNYYTFTVSAGCMPTYDFSFCAADGSNAAFDSQITILDNAGNPVAGGYNDDFCGLQSYVNWTPSSAGTYRVLVNSYYCTTGSTALLAYKSTTPPVMTYTSSTVTQASTATVTKCDLDQEIICVQIVTGGSCTPLSVTQFNLGAGSSTSGTLADVSKIHIYYTGTTNSFSTASEFLSGGTTPAGGSNTIIGSQTLASGTNYFWIAYDINPAATTGNVVDASCTSITVSGTGYAPSTTNPAGTRTINVCSSYPGTSALGLKHWVKSDAGVTLTGGAVSAWSDQSGAGITGNMTQGTAANRPIVITGAVNFQDYIRFDGSNDILVSANTFAGNSLFNTTDNTIFMIKNYKSGIVDYKWETDPTNSWRIGMELMGSGAQRIDFVDDNGGGKNDLSTVNVANKDVLVGYVSDASTITLKLNANTDAIKIHPSLLFNPPAGTLKPLNIGANDLGNPLYCNVDIAEALTFNKKLNSSEMRRVESYLCVKYGITLGNNKGTGASVIYMAANGTQIWNSHTGYHNYVIGIGRDNAAGNSGLNKLKSTSISSLNGSTDILTIANGTSLATPSAFGADNSFFITGSNAKTLASTAASLLDLPAGIFRRLERVWVAQETGTVGNVRMQFNMSTVPGVGGVPGANDLANVRLLIDADGVFATGSTIVVPSTYNNATDLVEFQFDFAAGTGFYYTIGSVDVGTAPLPVELIGYNVQCDQNKALIKWKTASESNNNYFSIEKSIDNNNFEILGTINGAGNSNITLEYTYVDYDLSEKAYYRLNQTDFDGVLRTLGTLPLTCENELEWSIHLNAGNIKVSCPVEGVYTYTLLSSNGEIVYNKTINLSQGINAITLNEKPFASGIYLVRIANSSRMYNCKISF